MTLRDRKKLAQLQRRLKAAQARYKSLEKRAGVIEEKRVELQGQANRLINALYSKEGQRKSAAKRAQWERRFVTVNKEAERLLKIENKIFEQLRELEEKVSTLEDNMRKTRKQNPGRKHLAGATAKQQRQYEAVLRSIKASGRYKGREKEVAARTVRSRSNPDSLPVMDRTSALWKRQNKRTKAAISKREKYNQSIVDAARRWYAQGQYSDEQIWKAIWNRYGYQGGFKNGVLTLNIDGINYHIDVTKKNPELSEAEAKTLPDKQYRAVTAKTMGLHLGKRDVRLYLNADKSVSIFSDGEEFYRVGKTGKVIVVPAKNPRRRKRNPKQSLKKAGRALKSAAKGILDTGAHVLAAGSKALANPDYPYWMVYHVDTKKTHPYDKTFLGSSNFHATKTQAIEQFRRSHYPGKLRAGTKIIAEKAVISKNPRKITLAKARQMGVDHARAGKKLTPYDAREIDQIFFAASRAQDPDRPAKRYAELRDEFNKGWQEAYYKLVSNPRRRNKAPRLSEADISKLSPKAQAQVRAQLGRIEEKEARAVTPAQKKTAAKARRSFLARLGTRLKVIGRTKKYKVSARDLGRCKRRVVKVRGRHHTDALAKARAELGSRYDDLRLKNRSRRNAAKKPQTKAQRLAKLALKGLRKKNQYSAGQLGFGTRPLKGQKAAKLRARLNRLNDRWQRATKPADLAKIKKQMDETWAQLKQTGATNPRKATAKTKGKRANPSAQSIRTTFAGRVSGEKRLYFPDGTPNGLAKLGRVVKIKTRSGTIQPARRNPNGEVWLCSDTRGHLHLGSTTKAPLFNGPARDLGEVQMIEYQESKPHLGYKNPIIWFHRMGEEGGRRPTLIANGKGELKFRGGSYRITSRGIEN